jgi:uncharacterized protein YdaT
MGRWKGDGYPVPDSQGMQWKKNILKEEILQEITENFMEMLLDNMNQNVQEALKKFQDNKIKDYEKTQKQISEP